MQGQVGKGKFIGRFSTVGEHGNPWLTHNQLQMIRDSFTQDRILGILFSRAATSGPTSIPEPPSKMGKVFMHLSSSPRPNMLQSV